MTAPRTAVMAEAKSSLVARHLGVRRGSAAADHFVVEDVSFELRPLELHGLVGAGGAGKTSLFQALAGLVPSIGDVLLGHVPLDAEQRRQHVLWIPEASDVEVPFADERARDVLRLTQRSLRVETAAVDDIVARMKLGELLDRRMGSLARGGRARVLLAAALLAPHGFLLLDEPLAHLEPKEADAVVNVLRTSTHEERSIAVALRSPSEAERLCDRFTLLSRGRVKAAGALHELRALAKAHPGAPLEEVIRALA